MYQEVLVKVVAKEALTPQMITAGAKLTRQLDEVGFDIVASFWLYTSEANEWLLVLASPYVTAAGPLKAYTRIQEVLRNGSADSNQSLNLQDTTVREDDDPLIVALRTGIKTRKKIDGKRYTETVINGQFIEDAYVYRVS